MKDEAESIGEARSEASSQQKVVPTPPIRDSGYSIQRQRVRPMPGPVTKDGQAISPMPPNLGRGTSQGPGGQKVQVTPSNLGQTKAFGYQGKVGL